MKKRNDKKPRNGIPRSAVFFGLDPGSFVFGKTKTDFFPRLGAKTSKRLLTFAREKDKIYKNGRFYITMKISTKGRYALRMMIDLAQHANNGFVTLGEIAARQDISKKYLEQIVPVLTKTDFLVTNRGYRGGYMLAKAPSQTTVGDILRATEGSLAPVACLDCSPNVCPRAADCVTLSVWQGLQKTVEDYLDGITLQDLLDKADAVGGNYII